jgi:hypothetical protein
MMHRSFSLDDFVAADEAKAEEDIANVINMLEN